VLGRSNDDRASEKSTCIYGTVLVREKGVYIQVCSFLCLFGMARANGKKDEVERIKKPALHFPQDQQR
jgi:hypothetical protein